MVPDPLAVGLFLCEQVITDLYTRNVSPIAIFTGLGVDDFPSENQRFSIFAILTGSQGSGRLELQVIRLDTDEEVYAQQFPLSMPDRTVLVNVIIRVRNISFPVPGHYEFNLLVDGSQIAKRRLRVYELPEPN